MDTGLPDLLCLEDGRPVRTDGDWRRQRERLTAQLLALEYGPLPSRPGRVEAEELGSHTVRRFLDATHTQYRLRAGTAQWVLDLLIPAGAGPRPVVLNGDGCWRYLTDGVTTEVLRRGYILAAFNRTEIVPDKPAAGRTGAIAAWAWGYHRCVDVLTHDPRVDPGRIAIVGHSRGGKTALLAGATDERIALVGDNASGCCGCAPFRLPAPGSERLADIVERFPYWFVPALREFVGREEALPFDQHALIALIAPRPLLITMALGDAWANPAGVWQSYAAAQTVWRFLGAEDRIGIRFRPGIHEHNATDWESFLDFADWQLMGKPRNGRFDVNPF